MKKNLTELVFILDASGSMYDTTFDTIGGFNSMIEQQKQQEGEALVTTVMFNNTAVMVHDRQNLQNIKPLTKADYVPQGSTALMDAVGNTINHIVNIHRYSRKEDIPENIIFVITTDGMENASVHYTSQKIKSMIEKEQNKYGWKFIFMGANIDACQTAESYGIDGSYAVDFHSDSQGTGVCYNTINNVVKNIRNHSPINNEWRKSADEDFKNRCK